MDRFLLSSLLSFFLSCSLFPSLLSALVFSDTACIVFRLLAASRQPSSARYWVSSKCRSVEQLRFDQTTSIGRQPRARGVAMVSRGVKDRELATKTHPPPPRCSPRSSPRPWPLPTSTSSRRSRSTRSARTWRPLRSTITSESYIHPRPRPERGTTARGHGRRTTARFSRSRGPIQSLAPSSRPEASTASSRSGGRMSRLFDRASMIPKA